MKDHQYDQELRPDLDQEKSLFRAVDLSGGANVLAN